MEPITQEYYEQWKVWDNLGDSLINKMRGRIEFIIKSIYKKFGREDLCSFTLNPVIINSPTGDTHELCSTIFDKNDFSGELVEYYFDNSYNDLSFPALFNKLPINLSRKFPSNWIEWNFEDELEDMVKEKEKEDKEKLEKFNALCAKYTDIIPKELSQADKDALHKIIRER